ncbi:LacI family transcriptional regulator [Amycolatopsis acidiphila]|uniref:LacI family transcriptional regulator n=1 Tax=Amycolatopsis acidiphila TaxID=715473 RepID=A0A558AM70_9PSEU|nr:LacI family DNA-binding transcriptional regulator [Amycolatopsis acidiphila]TVT25356.1 LacI family transcriptional regulator [Amycolatopsis acidiphila]UIJ62487.1 LacI family transcriptional regulator [Amycolatopsis acidiphila]GHG83906.1 LacI family transcriptional regulator [Amycolatopsis acidiphila]
MAVTLADVAKRAGVSSATVSRVLNGNYPVAARTRQRVLRAVSELNYVVNAYARALAVNMSDMLGVVVNDVSDPFFGLLAGAIQGEASREDLLAVICNTGGSPVEELRYVELLLRQRTRAIVLAGGCVDDADYLTELAGLIDQAASAGTRVVLCGRPPIEGARAVTLNFDNRGGARSLTRHLLAMGHRRIGYITGPPRHSTTTERLQGHREALAQHDVPWDEGLALDGGAFDRERGWEAAARLLALPDRPTAIIGANDSIALGVLAAVRESGLQVPKDVSVAGFDDLPFGLDAYPSLTTVRLPLLDAGRRAGRIAAGLDQAEPGAVSTIRPELIVRDSVAGPAS